MAPYPLHKQVDGFYSPHDWLMSLAMLCVICAGKNGTNGCHLAGFNEDIAFARHFMATPIPHAPIL